MRVPLSWVREYADLPPVTGREIAEALIRAGLEVEAVEPAGQEVKNVVVGEVVEVEELTGVKKPVRYCRVDAGEAQPRGVICGATNFSTGDRVPLALPGSVLPGGVEIGERTAYDRVSEGMICSAAELGISGDQGGIIVLPGRPEIGVDAVDLLALRDEVLDVAVTPDRGYVASVRGVAREAATAYGVWFRDPVDVDPNVSEGDGYPASIADSTACDRFVLRTVEGLDPTATSPLWLQRRLTLAGMRPLALAVDVTNYVMLESGQPLHAFDRAKLDGEIVVRRARTGERLETLDRVTRDLHPEDILITDASGPLSLAGTMGGLRSEIDETSTNLVLEAAHFSPSGTARMSRRHRLSTESSYRFERGVDPELPLRASARAVTLLLSYGGPDVRTGGTTHADAATARRPVTVGMHADHPDRVAGVVYGHDRVAARLAAVGCAVDWAVAGAADGAGPQLVVTPPPWRPDLTDPNDLAEEVIRLEGYDAVPSVLPAAPPGRGLTSGQWLRRRAGRALAAAGYVEVLSYPFVSPADGDAQQLPPDDERRRALRLANPLSEDEPLLRTTLLPGLFRTLARNVGRGFSDVALYETGVVYRPRQDGSAAAPIPPVERGPTAAETGSVEAALPQQPLHVAVVLAGQREPRGWWGSGRAVSWADAVEAAREVVREAAVPLTVRADQHAPWHPGRCAELLAGGRSVGHAGELHPRVVEAYGLPRRSCAMELELSQLEALAPGPVQAPPVSSYPVATLDVAVLVPTPVPAAEVEAALRAGAGPLLESLRLFDVYTGQQVAEGYRSLAYALRFRAPDRTLTVEEVSEARDAAVAEATRRTGAVLRGS